MKTILCLDGTNLMLENLFSVQEGDLYEVKVQKGKPEQIDEELFMLRKALRPNEKFEMTPLSIPKAYAECYGELLPNEIGMLSLFLLLNQSIKYSNVLRIAFIERILCFINNEIYPCIHKMNKRTYLQ